MLAVYGTLRKGMANHDLLKNAKLVWMGFVEIPYRLVVCNDVPYLVKTLTKRSVYVEVYEINKELLGVLDDFEGVPLDYVRIEIDTPVGRAWIYVASQELECVEIEDGDYASFIKKKFLNSDV